MGKLGLCVRYDCNNFGSMLQIFATEKLIEDFGKEYEIIRYNKRNVKFILGNVSRVLNLQFMKGKYRRIKKNIFIRSNKDVQEGNALRIKRLKEYRKKYIGPYSKVCNDYEELKKLSKNYDGVMVGSDQLWTPAGLKTGFYNLRFVPGDIKKISLATSFGVSRIPKNQIKETAAYLKRIDYLSVREEQGKRIIKKLTGRNAVRVLDPVLFYDKYQWDIFFENKKMIDGDYIFAYFLGENPVYRDAVERFARKKNMKIITCPHMDNFVRRDLKFGDKKLFDVSPVDFLNLIRNAKYICTDSFHGTAFSIIYNKEFVSFYRFRDKSTDSRNSRIDSILNILGLEDRIYNDKNGKVLKKYFGRNIDYDLVDKRLKRERQKSVEFLKEALE